MFHPVSGPRTEIELGGDTRVFIPELEPNKAHPIELPVPGLLEVHSVRVGDMALPAKHIYDVPDSRNFLKKLTVQMDMYQLAQNYEGKSILLRNMYSNDGRWQAGEKIYVTGVWEDAKAAPAPKGKQGKPEQKPDDQGGPPAAA